MKKSYLALLFASAAMLAACDSKELVKPDEPLPAKDKVPLQLTSGISTTRGMTRAFDTSWDANDQIGVFATVAGNSASITNSGSQANSNIAYKITTDQQTLDGTTHLYKAFEPSTEGTLIYLPADGSDIDVYAYYPWTSGVSASSPLSISIPTTQTLANQKSVDVLKAKALTSESVIDIDHTTAQLLFSHILSKVIIKVKAGTGYSAADLSGLTAVKIQGQPVTATFAPISQTLSITDASCISEIVPVGPLTSSESDYASDAVCTFRALLLPTDATTNPVSNTARKIEFTIGSGSVTSTYYYDMAANNIALESGTVTVFTITLQATGVSITAAISDWSEVTSVPEAPLYE